MATTARLSGQAKATTDVQHETIAAASVARHEMIVVVGATGQILGVGRSVMIEVTIDGHHARTIDGHHARTTDVHHARMIDVADPAKIAHPPGGSETEHATARRNRGLRSRPTRRL